MCLGSWPVFTQNWPSETTGQLGTIYFTMVHTMVKVSKPWLPVTSGQLTYRLEAVSNLRSYLPLLLELLPVMLTMKGLATPPLSLPPGSFLIPKIIAMSDLKSSCAVEAPTSTKRRQENPRPLIFREWLCLPLPRSLYPAGKSQFYTSQI